MNTNKFAYLIGGHMDLTKMVVPDERRVMHFISPQKLNRYANSQDKVTCSHVEVEYHLVGKTPEGMLIYEVKQ